FGDHARAFSKRTKVRPRGRTDYSRTDATRVIRSSRISAAFDNLATGRVSTMKSLKRIAVWAGIALGTASVYGCSSGNDSIVDPASVGTVGVQLQIAPGVTVNTVSWTISNAATGFNRSGTVNVQFSNTISFQVGGIPAGDGYVITLTATSVD